MKYLVVFVILILGFTELYSQEISIGNGNVTGCTGFLVDTGLSAEDYSPNEDITMTLCPEAPETIINLDFFVFSLGSGDEMTLYDGDSPDAPLIGTYTGTELQGVDITSTAGCITIHWTSDATGNGNFVISITCGQPCIAPIAAIASDNGQVLSCSNTEINFDASSTEFFNGAELASFLWDFGDGTTDNNSWPIAAHAYDEPGGYQVELYITDSNGCTSTNFVSLVVLIATEPTIDIAMESPVCVGSVSSYQVGGSFNTVPWQQTYSGISGGALFIPDDQTQVFSNSIDITGFAPLEVIDEESDIDFFFINFEHSFMGDLTIQFECPNGQTITVHQQGGGGTLLGDPVEDDDDPDTPGIGYDYWWSPTSTNGIWGAVNYNTLPSGTYESVDPWSNLFGCPINGIWTIQIADSWSLDNGFIFDWSIGFDPNLYPDLYTFTPSIGLDEDSSYWSIEPTISNISPDGNEITTTYTEGGIFEYTYNLVDNFGCTYSETYEVEVVQGPIADAGPDISLCVESDTIQAQITSSMPPFEDYVFTWNNTNNLSNSASLTPIVENLDNAETFVLSVFPVDNEQCTTTDTVNVSLMEIPSVGEDTQAVFCEADTPLDLFSIIEGNPDSGGIWLDQNNNEVSSFFDPGLGEDIVLTYTFPSCLVATQVTVDVDQLAFSLSSDTTICQNGLATLNVSVLAPNDLEIEYLWNQNIGNVNQIEVSPETTTTYTVSLVYGNGCTTDTQSSEVALYAPLNTGITPPSNLCPSEEILLEAINPTGGNGLYSFQWMVDGEVVGAAQEFLENPSVDATYCVTIDDQCESEPFSICTEISVDPLITPLFNSINVEGCYPISPTFTAIETNYNQVEDESWDFGDNQDESDVSSVTHQYTNPGTYTVTHTLTTYNGCQYESIEPFLVHAYPYPEANFYVDNGVSVLPNTTFLFHNIATLNYSNTWSFANNSGQELGTSTQESPYFTFPPNELGSYVATLTVESENGCQNTITREVSIEDFAIYIPTAFTANNDGINDYFFVQGKNIDETRFKMTLFNRWGVKVFETTDLYEKWDGSNNVITHKSKGNEGMKEQTNYFSQNEVYSYQIEVTSPGTTEIRIIKGVVTIIR